ncbi:hypothetical protein Agub_g10476, partial [Astrephomene gubernaculifera]
QSDLHISHCGGFHSRRLNTLVALLSTAAALFGHPPVQWDAETLGCDPSLSSLPTRDQRSFSSALAEVADWLLDTPRHSDEFIVLYLDDQLDLQAWGKVRQLLDTVTAALPAPLFITPGELEAITRELGSVPSIEQLVRQYGKRVLLMSGADYSEEMSWLAFNHHSPCDFGEPLFSYFEPAPHCSFHPPFRSWHQPTMRGRLLRSPTCHLSYGPYNCSMKRGENI